MFDDLSNKNPCLQEIFTQKYKMFSQKVLDYYKLCHHLTCLPEELWGFENIAAPLIELYHNIESLYHLLKMCQKLEIRNCQATVEDAQRQIRKIDDFRYRNSVLSNIYKHLLSKGDLPAYQYQCLQAQLNHSKIYEQISQENVVHAIKCAQQISSWQNSYTQLREDFLRNWVLPLTHEDIQPLSQGAKALAKSSYNEHSTILNSKFGHSDYYTHAVTLKKTALLENILHHHPDRMLRSRVFAGLKKNYAIGGNGVFSLHIEPLFENIFDYRQRQAYFQGFKSTRHFETYLHKISPEIPVNILYRHCLERLQLNAREQWDNLAEFALRHDNIEQLTPADLPYYAHRMQEEMFQGATPREQIFPLNEVLAALNEKIHNFFGISLKEVPEKPHWHFSHPFELITEEHLSLGVIYTDLFERENKNHVSFCTPLARSYFSAGAWSNGSVAVCCNFPENAEKTISLNEILILFHEMGYALCHLLARTDSLSISGITHLPRDIVEAFARMMEYWALEPEVLIRASNNTFSFEKASSLCAHHQSFLALQMLEKLQIGYFDWILNGATFWQLYKNDPRKYNPTNLWSKITQHYLLSGCTETHFFASPLKIRPVPSPLSEIHAHFIGDLYACQILEKIKEYQSMRQAGEILSESLFSRPGLERSDLTIEFLKAPLSADAFLRRLAPPAFLSEKIASPLTFSNPDRRDSCEPKRYSPTLSGSF